MKSVYNDNQFLETHIDKVIYHLKILNEDGIKIIEENRNQGERKICEIIQIVGRKTGADIFDECTPEGDSEKAKRLNLPFLNNQSKEMEIRCSPHIKYYYSNYHYRTYFGLPIESIANGKKIPIGSIGKHL